jgi:hypothetical protein
MYIKDNVTGTVRLYGTNCHDSLEISDDGKYLTYYNLQCGEGSKYGGFSFAVDENGTLPKDDEVLVKHGAKAYFNIGGWPNINDVLDRIRTEIDEQIIPRSSHTDRQKKEVLKIIDKYRGNKE